MKGINKKILAFICAIALVVTSMTGVASTTASAEDTVADITVSSAVKDYGTVSGYKYLGYAYLNGATSAYKYLVIKYTGDITNFRVTKAAVKDGYEADGTEYWMRQSSANAFKLVGSNQALSSETEATLVIDLEATGIDLDGYGAFHMHYNDGTLNITDFRLTANEPEGIWDDIVLDNAINDFGTVDYKYGGKVSFENATSAYKYMVISYIGSISRYRLGFNLTSTGTYDVLRWIDPSQTGTTGRLTLVGNPVFESDTETTVIIDLEASGIDAGEVGSVTIHYGPGTLNVTDCRLTTTLPEVEEETTTEVPSEEETTTPEPEVTKYEVSVDGTVVATVEEGATYTLGDAVNGYICGADAYKAGTEVTVTSDMVFTTIGDVTVTAAGGAGIRYAGTAGIRFQAKVNAPEEVLNSAAVTTGTIITAKDIYDVNGKVLTLEAIADKNEYAALNVVNNGWYNNVVGTYCGSVVDIVESNYIRNFIAVAYATITYTDGTSTTVYSNMTGARSIKGVAAAVAAAGYVGIDAADYATIDAFAAAK